MLFNSLKFLVFFPLVFMLYWALPHRARKYLLLAASYYFYMCWKPEFIVLILYSTAVDYFCALGMERRAEQKKLFLAVSLTMNLGLLFFFKYFNFFGATLTALCRAVSIPFSAPVLSIILPVGISFYTFQTLSYTIDVYRGKMKAEHDFLYFALFVSYFPQLVAGPIEKAVDLLPQLKAEHRFDYDRTVHGARLMAWGFFKKCVCAAYLGALVDKVYGNVEAYGGGAVVLATAAFSFQLYCDFGGYSDIARGCSEMLGVELTKNFIAPNFATSTQELRRRWHTSLSRWFREYIYFPLGGSRKGFGRTVLNTWIVFFLSGLWHGAAWGYVLWGLVSGVLSAAEVIWQKSFAKNSHAEPSLAVVWLQRVGTYVLFSLSLTFFMSALYGVDWSYLTTNITLGWNTFFADPNAFCAGLSAFGLGGRKLIVLIFGTAAVLAAESRGNIAAWIRQQNWSIRWTLYYALGLGILFYGAFGQSVFIYQQY